MSFDRVACFYDQLATLVFGDEWNSVQVAPTDSLNRQKNILIVGGGTGVILPHLNEYCHVTYVELSKKMIDKARMRKHPVKTEFINEDFLKWHPNITYDAILMPFFLDCFDEVQLDDVIEKTRHSLNPDGELLVVDFQQASFVQNLLVKGMYLFFRIVSRLKGRQLLDLNGVLIENGLERIDQITYLKQWVFYSRFKLT
ncbi:MAG: class I SAM-dependent methyltransferase [Cyclobacteriaceae bacterium]